MTKQGNPIENPRWFRRIFAAGDCPQIELLFQWQDQTLPQEQRKALTSHITDCARCQTELELRRQFEVGDVLPHEEADVDYITSRLKAQAASGHTPVDKTPHVVAVPESRKGVFADWVLSLSWKPLASLAALLLLAVVYLNLPSAPPSVTVEPPSSGVLRSSRIVLLAPAEEVASAPELFQWEGIAGASRYQLELEEIDGTVIWRALASETSIQPPDDVKLQLLPGKRVFWRVLALDPQGVPVAESGKRPLVVVRGGGS